MPEAVSSNSIPVPERQHRAFDGVPTMRSDPPFTHLSPYVQRDFDAVEEMLRAHAMMTSSFMETGKDCSLYSKGIHLIHQLIMLRLDDVAEFARTYIEEQSRDIITPFDKGLMDKVGRLVATALCATGVDCDYDNMADWSDDVAKTYAKTTARYYRELLGQLKGDGDIIDAGSLLPWLELKIRRDLLQPVEPAAADVEPKQKLSNAQIRDQFISESLENGLTSSDIAQVLNIRRKAVERAIGRLSAHPVEHGNELRDRAG